VYFTFFDTRKELTQRISYLLVCTALAGAYGGLLADGIGFLNGKSGMKGWRWIRVTEGLPAIVLGPAAYFFLADSPEEEGYLSEEEKRFVVARREREVTQTSSAQEFHWGDVKKCFLDWKCWALYDSFPKKIYYSYRVVDLITAVHSGNSELTLCSTVPPPPLLTLL